MIRLWLDDTRPAPAGWHWVRTAEEAIAWLLTAEVERASLDYHLGCGLPRRELREVLTGYDVLVWLEEHVEQWPPQGIAVHSEDDPAGRQQMEELIGRVQKARGISGGGGDDDEQTLPPWKGIPWD